MSIFSKLLAKKKEEPSNFLHYKDSATGEKADSKIYDAIFARQIDYTAYNDHTIARLRARTGVSLEDAKVLLGESS